MKLACLVRRATLADLPALIELEALFPSDAMTRRTLRRFILAPNAAFLIAEHNGRVMGNLLMLTRRDTKLARIYSVIVSPAARGLGLGRELVVAAENEARQRGCSAMVLEVRVDNVVARTLYERLGYTLLKPLPGYYEDEGDGLRLRKPLHPAE